jgi:hypothetical protein
MGALQNERSTILALLRRASRFGEPCGLPSNVRAEFLLYEMTRACRPRHDGEKVMKFRTSRKVAAFAGTLALMVTLEACGGGGSTGPSVVATPTPVPGAALAATGEGALVIHPSLDTRFAFALETPLRITETGGGTADWNFARISFFRNGAEVERFELGADAIRIAGLSRITARSNQLIRVAFRLNSDDFDRVDITLGFGDLKDGRQFTVLVPFGSFSGVNISLTPLSVPPQGTLRLGD